MIVGVGIFLLEEKTSVGNKLVFEREYDGEKTKEVLSSIVAIDSDKDGLLDWEESLWGTDPQNPDSDGDSTPDGEEVRAGRNPAKAAPNDELESVRPKESVERTPENSEEVLSGTLTGILAETSNLAYTVLQQTGELDEESRRALESLFVKDILSNEKLDTRPPYRLSDISIAPKENEEAFEAYKSEMESISLSYIDGYPDNPIEVVERALSENDEVELEKLGAIESAYRAITGELLTLEVPSEIAQTHLDMVNMYDAVTSSIEQMQGVLKDPLLGLIGITRYQEYIESMIIITNELSAFLYGPKE